MNLVCNLDLGRLELREKRKSIGSLPFENISYYIVTIRVHDILHEKLLVFDGWAV